MVKLVYYTRLLSAHEMPLFDAMARRCAEAVYVVESEGTIDGRVGWTAQVPSDRLIVLGRLSPTERREVWGRLLTAETLVYYGYRDSPWREMIVGSAARVVYVGERWLRPVGWLPGWVRFLSPRFRRTVRWYRQMLATRPNFRCFAQGVHAVSDFRRLGFEKVEPWGYFIDRGNSNDSSSTWTRRPRRVRIGMESTSVDATGTSRPRRGSGRDGSEERQIEGGDEAQKGLRILSIGRLVPLKHVDTLVRAVAAMKTREVTLTIAGDGPSRLGLQELVRRMGLGERVRFVGAVKMADVRQFMREHDVFVLTSDAQEGWGMTVSEALAERLSVFGTDEAGASATLLPTERRFRCGDWRRLAELLDSPLARERQTLPDEWTAEWAAERVAGMRFETPWENRDGMPVAASFWEEHCTECGEPDCYRTCARFVKGRGGRCRRFAGGLKETILCEGVEVEFLPWGKMEAFFHGGMISRARAERLERLMARTAWLRRLAPRWWRSWRWRWALRGATKGSPNFWRIKAVAERDESLVLQVVDAELKELVRESLRLTAGSAVEASVPIPPVADGALFRIFAANGEATGKIRFERCQLVKCPESQHVKCLAWDLDGTLWQGTLSEDGAEGLSLNATAIEVVKELDRRGIVNSICSKNDAAEALAALKKFGIEEYFVFPQIGWGPKSEGLRTLSREMNIGLDAIAFVDDREEVRGEVRANAPEVRVFAAEEMTSFLELPEFNPPTSAESVGRRARYREEMSRREAVKAFGGDAAAFLAASGLEIELKPVEGERAERCRELVQRTNQLNLTGRRYDEAAFAKLLKETECHAVHVWDKYGDYGVVGFVAMRGTHIVECCFSCRVAEKGVERRVLEKLAAGRKLTADVAVTPRNGKIREIVTQKCMIQLCAIEGDERLDTESV